MLIWAHSPWARSPIVIIIRPTGDSFSILSLLAVLGMLGFAGRDLASRAAPSTLGTDVLGFYGFLSVVVAGLAYQPLEGAPMVAMTCPRNPINSTAVLNPRTTI